MRFICVRGKKKKWSQPKNFCSTCILFVNSLGFPFVFLILEPIAIVNVSLFLFVCQKNKWKYTFDLCLQSLTSWDSFLFSTISFRNFSVPVPKDCSPFESFNAMELLFYLWLRQKNFNYTSYYKSNSFRISKEHK